MTDRSGLAATREGAVLWLRLQRPEARNGIDGPTREALESALLDADTDRSVRVVVITGSGRDFCTGADLAGGDGPAPTDVLGYRKALVPFQRLFRTLWELETPVISAVNGTVAGVGWMLALLADLVVAAEDARWTHVFSRRGMAPHAGDPYYLPRILPFHVLNEIALLSDTITTPDLARWGAVNRVVPAGEVEATARALAERVGAGPTLSYGQAKRLYRRSLESDLTTALAEEATATAMLSPTNDRAEGVAALLERRPATFTGS